MSRFRLDPRGQITAARRIALVICLFAAILFAALVLVELLIPRAEVLDRLLDAVSG